VLPASDYFEDYILPDRLGNAIKFAKPIEYYYPRIFSILPMGREVVEMKKLNSLLTTSTVNNWEDYDEELCEDEVGEIREIVRSYIEDKMNDCYSIGTYNNGFLQLKRTKSFLCPTTGLRDHDSRDGYVTVNSKTGKLYLGCYCNEGKCIAIGTFKEVETTISPVDFTLYNFDCDEASSIYYRRNKSSIKNYDGMTYGDIVKQDIGFAKWICDKNIYPHARVFCKILGRKFDDTIKLDNIKPNEVINKNNIGSYLPRLEKADVVCVRSNMMTYKTQRLKELMNNETDTKFKRILIVSFRCSLVDEYMNVFEKYGFQLYSKFKGLIKGDRIIVQIDSLWKVRGEFDLLICDEMVYTMNHLNSFVKRKQEVWDALNQYIEGTPKIIACDALLDNKTIQLFKNNYRSTWVVENLWKSFSGKKVKYIDFIDFERTVKYITENLKQWGSIYLPTNSRTFAEKIFHYLKESGIKVGLDSSDTEPTPSSEWKQYDVFITTPTNVAGVSCNDEFGKTIAYFTSMSCTAEMSSQMIFRVRNTKSPTYDVFLKLGTMGNSYPIKINEIKKWIQDKDELILKSGLKINYIRSSIVEDEYYNNYIHTIKKQNLSKVMFKQVLNGILQAHGLEEDLEEEVTEEKTINEKIQEALELGKELEEIKITTKVSREADKKKSRVDVCNARLIDDNTFKELNEKYRKTKAEKLELRKYNLVNTYGTDITLTESFVKTYEKIIPQYINLGTMNTNHLQDYIEDTLNKYEKIHKNDENVARLHERRHLLKLWAVDNMIKALGFNNVWDNKIIQQYPYDKAKDFLIEHGDNISLLFKTNKVDWTEIDDKKKISDYINNRLKSICNVTVKNKHKGKLAKILQEYCIQGLDIWDKGGIKINKNKTADTIYKQKNYKRIIIKNKVNKNVWECVSKLIKIKG
jgi:hypothetical protein